MLIKKKSVEKKNIEENEPGKVFGDRINMIYTYRRMSWTRTRVAIPCSRKTWMATCLCTRSLSSASCPVCRRLTHDIPTAALRTGWSPGPRSTSVRTPRAWTCVTQRDGVTSILAQRHIIIVISTGSPWNYTLIGYLVCVYAVQLSWTFAQYFVNDIFNRIFLFFFSYVFVEFTIISTRIR